ncbi:hypothetical protein PGH42_00355 [Legionella pneumophila]|nr:hypothetical protein PGH42_18555 [Legionella pneumophila]WBV71656.1 hypothetical protein PGH42_00355 [Legionella pneumophila]
MKRMIGFMVSVMLTFAVNAADSQVNTHKHQTDKGKVTQVCQLRETQSNQRLLQPMQLLQIPQKRLLPNR